MRFTKLVRASGLALLTLVAALPPPASATTLFPEEFTCPIGGEKFEDYVVGSSSSWGQRPDGRAYGTLPVYPLVECPGNGFPIFQEDFSPEEVALFTRLVAGETFQARRESETAHYRLWWLMKEARRDAAELAGTLLVASWETDEDPVRKARYQREFVYAAARLAPSDGDAGFYYNLRAANALRELGRFDDAATLLNTVASSGTWPEDEDDREYARFLIDGLTRLVAEGNPHSEPANLVPPNMAVERCVDEANPLSPAEEDACATPVYQEAIAEHREYEELSVKSGEEVDGSVAAAAAAAAMADAEADMAAAAAATADSLNGREGKPNCYIVDNMAVCVAMPTIDVPE